MFDADRAARSASCSTSPIGGRRGVGDRARPAGPAGRRPAASGSPARSCRSAGWRPGSSPPTSKDRGAAAPAAESALTAALRAIDTTLWTVDTFAGLGSEHVAGLVGRPIAVVRAAAVARAAARGRLDLSDPERAAERTAAEQALAAEGVPRADRRADPHRRRRCSGSSSTTTSSTCTSSTRSWPAAGAGRPGRTRRTLGDDPATRSSTPTSSPRTPLTVHLGQRLTLTLLMHPAGKVHLTSGVLPRKALALAREWVAPGLARLSPSLRTGPVLIDPDQVRLPKPSVFGADQVFTRRDHARERGGTTRSSPRPRPRCCRTSRRGPGRLHPRDAGEVATR